MYEIRLEVLGRRKRLSFLRFLKILHFYGLLKLYFCSTLPYFSLFSAAFIMGEVEAVADDGSANLTRQKIPPTTTTSAAAATRENGTPTTKPRKAGTAARQPIGWKPLALDGGYGWVVVLGSFLIHVFADGFVYSFGVIAESLVKEFNASNAEVSTVLSLLTGLMLAAGPVASAVCNRIGCRITTIMGAVIASIGCALSHYAQSMTHLILSVGIVMGTGFGFMYCPAIVIVTMYFERYRSLATGVTVCGAGVGTFIFSRIIAFLIIRFDWRTVFLIYAGLVLLCVPCGALYRPIEFVPIYEEDANEKKNGKVGWSSDDDEEDAEDSEVISSKGESDLLLAGRPAENGNLSGSARKKNICQIVHHHNTETIPEEEDAVSDEYEADGGGREGRKPKSAQNLHFEHIPANAKNGEIRSAISQQLHGGGDGGAGTDDKRHLTGGGGAGCVLQRFRSLGEHLHLTSTLLPQNATNVAAAAPPQNGIRQQQYPEKISVSTGYLNVKDVFYHGSMAALPQYTENQQRFRSISSLQSQHNSNSNRDHHGSAKALMTRGGAGSSSLRHPKLSSLEGTATTTVEPAPLFLPLVAQKIDEADVEKDASPPQIEEDDDREEDSSATSASRAIEIWNTIKRMMDLSLLVDPVYLMFAISNFLTSIGFNAPPMFMPMNGEMVLGFSKENASATVSAYGLANTFGRIAFGLLCDRQLPCRWGRDCARNRLWIYNWTLMLCGLASCFVFRMTTFGTFTTYCFFFGFTISSYVCLTSVVLVDLVGVDRLTNAFGLLLFIQGLATFVGPPLAGQLYDLTKRYDWTFAFCGVCLFVSGAMLFVVGPLQRRKRLRSSSTTIHHSNAAAEKPPQKNGKLIRLEEADASATLKNGTAPLTLNMP